jgi:hypothetical protein
MVRHITQTVAAIAILAMFLGALASPALADYTPTPLAKALSTHEFVFVGTVKECADGKVKIAPTTIDKGKAPDGLYGSAMFF